MKLFGFIAVLLPAAALAQAADTSSAAATAAGSPYANFIPFALIAAVMYMFMIRPQMKRQKELAAMQSGLKKGDEVVTSGGIVAKFAREGEAGIVIAEIAPGIEVRILRSTIASVANKSNATVPANQIKKKTKDNSLTKNDNVVLDKDQVANDN